MIKGFTLVELLAVIVILAVLALIATPVVLSIIDDAKKSAMIRSAEMYLSGVENAVMRENMNSGGNFRPSECTISNGNMTCGTTNVEVEVDGEVPNSGYIIFENGKIISISLIYKSLTMIKDENETKIFDSKTLSAMILGNNKIQSDENIDFGKSNSTYSEKRSDTTKNVSFRSNYSYYFATDYILNEDSGFYALAGEIIESKWSEVNYETYPYTCMINVTKYTWPTVPCSTMYEMIGYTSTSNGIGYSYIGIPNYDNGQGIYYTSKNTENSKPTYYFRGSVDNNYVQFGTRETNNCVHNGTILYDSEWMEINDKDTCKQITSFCNIGSDGYDEYRTISEDSCVNDYGGIVIEKSPTWEIIPIIWRIVRINEDGSIRLITQDSVGSSSFNENYGDNAYVGYMYGTAGSSTYEETHKNTNSSTIKTYLENWYETNLSSYSNLFADAGFCNDRSVAPSTNAWDSTDTALGYGTNKTYYGAFNRVYNFNQPQFACPQTNDLFTTTTSNNGNKSLTYPIGLLSWDEAVYSGISGNFKTQSSGDKRNEYAYIMDGGSLYLMSPYYGGSGAYITHIGSDGVNFSSNVYSNWSYGIRPVINLKSDVKITGGDGTKSNPYVIKTD